MSRYHRTRGADGERQAVAALAAIGITARRSASMQAGRQSHGFKVPDLVCEGPAAHLWIEVKRTDSPSAIWQGLQQAGEGVQREGETRTTPVVMYRADRRPWLAVVPVSYAAPCRATLAPTAVASAPDACRAVWGGDPCAVVRRADLPAVYVAQLHHFRDLVGLPPLDTAPAAT